MNQENETTDNGTAKSFEKHTFLGLALDPIHVGTGGSRLGRVDNTIVRDPATRIPKIPGSSLAGVMRAYLAMAEGKYPGCAGQGLGSNEDTGHCGKPDCPVCTIFGFAKGQKNQGGFAGLAGFSDMQVLLFPVPTRQGPLWLGCPMILEQAGLMQPNLELEDEVLYLTKTVGDSLNLGWLELDAKPMENRLAKLNGALKNTGLPAYVREGLALVSDRIFTQVINSNLEVRTSVAIDPAIGAAQDGALFTYEALPRSTVLTWDIICRHPDHFRIGRAPVSAVTNFQEIIERIDAARHYLEHLGIGGMGTRGMGRLRVLGEVSS